MGYRTPGRVLPVAIIATNVRAGCPAALAQQTLPPYLENRLRVQGRYLEEIARTFGNQVVGHVPELERDVTGLPMIERLAAVMYGDAYACEIPRSSKYATIARASRNPKCAFSWSR